MTMGRKLEIKIKKNIGNNINTHQRRDYTKELYYHPMKYYTAKRMNDMSTCNNVDEFNKIVEQKI